MDRIVAAFGGIDIWVNAAAALLLGSFETLSPDAFRRVVETNLFGYVNGSRSAMRQFQTRGDRGILVNVSSMLGVIAEPQLTAYVATKFAIRGFTASLRQEMQDRPGIPICTMLPAAIDTPIYQKAGNLAGRRVRSIIPVYAVEPRKRSSRWRTTAGAENIWSAASPGSSPSPTSFPIRFWKG